MMKQKMNWTDERADMEGVSWEIERVIEHGRRFWLAQVVDDCGTVIREKRCGSARSSERAAKQMLAAEIFARSQLELDLSGVKQHGS